MAPRPWLAVQEKDMVKKNPKLITDKLGPLHHRSIALMWGQGYLIHIQMENAVRDSRRRKSWAATTFPGAGGSSGGSR